MSQNEQQEPQKQQKLIRPKLEKEAAEKMTVRKKEISLVRKIVWAIVSVGIVLALVVGFAGYKYVTEALQPLEPDSTEIIEVEIPIGTSTKGITQILEDKKIIKNATIFNYYIKTQNVSDFQAGFYELSPSMKLNDIIAKLQEGGSSVPDQKILIKEGDTAEEIATEIEAKTDFTAAEFLALLNNPEFLASVTAKFPDLLTEATQRTDTRYKLEGYLFPATYDYLMGSTLEGLVTQMLQKANDVIVPYKDQIAAKGYTIHQILTIASLVEKEGVTPEDRAKIASVFFNRLAIDMPIQSDISILYALNVHKELVTFADLEIDSPYNLYKNTGMGPGPFDSPSEGAIKATLNPATTNYLYFVADTKTGIVYFAETYEQHLENQSQYVDSK
ncbi:Hypothetical protein Tpal_1852 [Trichococcus palustris]|uniref:Endolytic murein transglycosylase n=1 Tax=Trichococcus palustris TaxID=140314 RepID=A0A143YQU1_9LACT|nr:endolytic transglycosylase MltG [Trichococcus palustris]CZQ95179.1 Hypothetical protein Tpal_1852 [Trichococcus palustris]SFK92877.1 UPF0755 protein [Trichococcus palustris]